MKNKKLIFIFLLYLIAGITHLVSPELFVPAIPHFFKDKNLIVYLTGILELAFLLGIIINRYRSFTLLLSTLYLTALIPIHILVSINGIEMFGVNNPVLLWSRTFLQIPLIFINYQEMIKAKNENNPHVFAHF